MLEAAVSVAIIVAISLVYIYYLPDLNPFIPLILCIVICFPILYAGEMKKHRSKVEQRDK